MARINGKELGQRMLDAVREYVASKTATISELCHSIGDRVKALEDRAPVPGPKGDKGDPGIKGDPGESIKGDKGDKGDPGESIKGDKGDKGDPGESVKGDKGDKGDPGESIKGEKGDKGDPGESIKGEKGDKGDPGESIKGDKGEPGQDGGKGDKGDKGDSGESIKGDKGDKGDNGESIKGDKGDKGDPGGKGDKGDPGSKGDKGDPGEDGRHAAELNPLSSLDVEKSYPKGTYVEYREGMIRAVRATDPLLSSSGHGFLEKAGWSVCMNGVFDVTEETLDEGRTIIRSTEYTNGRISKKEIKTSVVLYKGIWKEKTEYEKGDQVTRHGSQWYCSVGKTTGEPRVSRDWVLAVKCGNNGKDGNKGDKGDKGDPGRDGKDLTQMAFDGSKI